MKRMLVSLLCLLMCVSLFACTSANNNTTADKQTYAIDLEKCDIGYELPCYPSSDFKFKTYTGEIVEISNFKVVLKEKNTIISEDAIDEEFMHKRFVVTVTFDGKVNPTLVGKAVNFSLADGSNCHEHFFCSSETVVGEDGKFSFSGVTEVNRYIYEFLFGSIRI